MMCCKEGQICEESQVQKYIQEKVDGEVSPLFPLSAPTKLYSTVMFASALCLVLLSAILLAMCTPGGGYLTHVWVSYRGAAEGWKS